MMPELTLPPEIAAELADIYQAMQAEYDCMAAEIRLTCPDCPDNCCDSWFFHHTHLEWAYLWQGLRRLDAHMLRRLVNQAEEYIRQSQGQIAAGQRPQLMCPLNEGGRCCLYEHRLLICRMHGVPAALTLPDGRTARFLGCSRCQEIVGEKDAPHMDRTPFLSRLAALEASLLGGSRQSCPKVKKTIAEMIVLGPPPAAG
jgi:hypothetical protein